VDGRWVDGSEGRLFEDVNPATGEVLAVVSQASGADVERAVEAAWEAQRGKVLPASSIYTSDVRKAFQAMRDLDMGILYVNHGTIGAEIQLPFGGTKGTGNGRREAAWAALDVVCEGKSIYVDFSGRLQRARIDPVKVGE